jgi:RNA polymerase sigma-70 factor (ECF subfamily)
VGLRDQGKDDAPQPEESSPSLPAADPSAGRLRKLFAALAEGDVDALAPLYDLCAAELHGLALWRAGSREDAEDVIQDLFCRLADHRHRLAQVDDPRAYLLAIVHRLAIDRHRARGRRREEPLESVLLVAAPETDPDTAEDARRASRALAQLPAPQREALYLHQMCDLPYAAVGRITGVPTFTAASRCRLGLRALRRLLELPP